MRINPDAPLTPQQFQSLRELSKTLGGHVPDEDEEYLIEIGYAKHKLGGLGLTDAGRMRLARGR
ncbi:MAG TPA: hypothetical protein VHQ39_08080 [Dongiaceae bacterium]|jgi:hypothetical protein|nr:hypothetical protein [Dongiaceae bacterium]